MNIFHKNRCNVSNYSDENIVSSKGKDVKSNYNYNSNIVEEKTTIYEIDERCMRNKNNR